jgi:hypothetical protein
MPILRAVTNRPASDRLAHALMVGRSVFAEGRIRRRHHPNGRPDKDGDRSMQRLRRRPFALPRFMPYSFIPYGFMPYSFMPYGYMPRLKSFLSVSAAASRELLALSA